MSCPGCMSTTKNGECDGCRKLKKCRKQFDSCCDEEKIYQMKCSKCHKQNKCLCFTEFYLNKFNIRRELKNLNMTI